MVLSALVAWLMRSTVSSELLREWLNREDLEMRNPISLARLRALVAISFSWGWFAFGLLMWITFHCLLRPDEGYRLKPEAVHISPEQDYAVVDLGPTKMALTGSNNGKAGFGRLGDRGPTFGSNHDMYVANNANSNSDSYTNLSSTYTCPQGG